MTAGFVTACRELVNRLQYGLGQRYGDLLHSHRSVLLSSPDFRRSVVFSNVHTIVARSQAIRLSTVVLSGVRDRVRLDREI